MISMAKIFALHFEFGGGFISKSSSVAKLSNVAKNWHLWNVQHNSW